MVSQDLRQVNPDGAAAPVLRRAPSATDHADYDTLTARRACSRRPAARPGPASFAVPADLRQFYEICGGLVLFSDAPFVWRSLHPELIPSHPEIVGEQFADDITASWFSVASTRPRWSQAASDATISETKHPRNGRCGCGWWCLSRRGLGRVRH